MGAIIFFLVVLPIVITLLGAWVVIWSTVGRPLVAG